MLPRQVHHDQHVLLHVKLTSLGTSEEEEEEEEKRECSGYGQPDVYNLDLALADVH